MTGGFSPHAFADFPDLSLRVEDYVLQLEAIGCGSRNALQESRSESGRDSSWHDQQGEARS